MDIGAAYDQQLGPMESVELCECPAGFTGLSCEVSDNIGAV